LNLLEDFTTDANVSGEGALVVHEVLLHGGLGCLEAYIERVSVNKWLMEHLPSPTFLMNLTPLEVLAACIFLELRKTPICF